MDDKALLALLHDVSQAFSGNDCLEYVKIDAGRGGGCVTAGGLEPIRGSVVGGDEQLDDAGGVDEEAGGAEPVR